MVETVSTNNLAKKLKDIFCAENRVSRKYSEVWLSDVDFGGLYTSDKYVVNVKAEHEIESCNEEIKYIITHLFKQLTSEEISQIWRVDVYNSYEIMHCSSGQLPVFKSNEACLTD